jgi:hypothetical protein
MMPKRVREGGRQGGREGERISAKKTMILNVSLK